MSGALRRSFNSLEVPNYRRYFIGQMISLSGTWMQTVAAIWLIGQCSVFVRNRDRLAEPPIGLELDEAMVEWLGHSISRWVMAGLGGPAPRGN